MTPAPMRSAAAAVVLSGDVLLLDRVRGDGFTAVVHSVFERVVNLRASDSPRLCCLAARTVDDAPDTVVLDVASCASLGLRPGDVLTAGLGVLRAPSVVIDLTGAQPWEPVLPTLPMPAASLSWLRGFVRARRITGADDPWLAAVEPLLARRMDELLGAIRRGNDAAIARSGRGLVGLGAGLTPSGDDMLVGVSLVANLPGSALAPVRAALGHLVQDSAGRTTDISYATLAHAATGRVRESVVALLRAMAGGSSDRQLDSHGERVAAIGHTSGVDILTGLSAALDLDAELRDRRKRAHEPRGDR